MAAASKRPSLHDVRKAAEALKEGDAESVKAVFDLLLEVKDRTRADDDIIVGVVKNALGKTVTVKTVRGMLKGAEAQLASERAALLGGVVHLGGRRRERRRERRPAAWISRD